MVDAVFVPVCCKAVDPIAERDLNKDEESLAKLDVVSDMQDMGRIHSVVLNRVTCYDRACSLLIKPNKLRQFCNFNLKPNIKKAADSSHINHGKQYTQILKHGFKNTVTR
ncbi:hypothetical protein VTP01DRAFT_5093, partial [Rhizomucor pusillus]|uniref:uncharacterized protein n=1 Tax=Rhizomucor pusillus TaxID=4840 RepID=UPI003742C61A